MEVYSWENHLYKWAMASMAMLNNQRVSHNEQVLFENTIFAGQAQMSVPSPTGWGPRFRSRSVAEQKSD